MSVQDYTKWADQRFPDSDASVFIQWKGTDVCMDFHCPCGADCHIDGAFTYSVRCGECGATYDLGTQVNVRRTDVPFGEPKDMQP